MDVVVKIVLALSVVALAAGCIRLSVLRRREHQAWLDDEHERWVARELKEVRERTRDLTRDIELGRARERERELATALTACNAQLARYQAQQSDLQTDLDEARQDAVLGRWPARTTRVDIMQALARGYTYPRNGAKVADHDLVADMATEVVRLLEASGSALVPLSRFPAAASRPTIPEAGERSLEL